MKKLFLLLTAISTVGFAGNTLTVETGINGDVKSSDKKMNVPVSIKLAHKQDGFSASLKASNEAEFLWAETKNKFDFKETQLEATLGYESEKFSRTTWNFELAPSTQLKDGSFAFSGNTGFKHDFGVLQLGESLSYKYETGATAEKNKNTLTAKVTLDVPVKAHKVSSYLEGGYNFATEKYDLNAKVGATIKHDLFTYSPYVETKNVFKKADGELESSKTTFEVGAFSLSPKGVNVDTTLNFVLTKDKSVSLNSSVEAKYKYAFNEKVSLTPSVKVELKSELKEHGKVNLDPSLGLAVNQKLNDKLGLDYKLEANLGSEFKYDSDKYKGSLNKAELKAGFTVKYNF